MDEYLIQGSTLTDIADAIREKTGDSALMTPAEMVEAIEGIESGGVGVSTFKPGTYTNCSVDESGVITQPGNVTYFGPIDLTEEIELTSGDVITIVMLQGVRLFIRYRFYYDSTLVGSFETSNTSAPWVKNETINFSGKANKIEFRLSQTYPGNYRFLFCQNQKALIV